MRLDKYLSDMGFGTRKEVKVLIRDKRVTINDEIIVSPNVKVGDKDCVAVDGALVRYVEFEYYLMNKPQGYVCANEDDINPVLLSLIDSVRNDLSTVGRLDKDTEGAILITNDGMMNHRLLSVKNHVDKVYYFQTDSDLPADAKTLLEKPMDLGDFTTLPAAFEQLGNRSGRLTICEGKYHQVKRMLQKIGCTITYLKREKFSFLSCEGLKCGQYRSLSEQEIAKLKEH